ncbi:uncharacterized protein SETTUDRAFT_162273, partial [Exserohilum turcica Et28A]
MRSRACGRVMSALGKAGGGAAPCAAAGSKKACLFPRSHLTADPPGPTSLWFAAGLSPARRWCGRI